MQKTQNDVSIDAIAFGFQFGFGEMASISSRGGHVHAFTYDYVKTRPEHPTPHDLSATQSEAPRSECVVIDVAKCGFRSGFGEMASISFCLESAIASGFQFGFGEMASISSRRGHVCAFTYNYVKTRPEYPAPHDLLSSGGGNKVCFATTPPDMEASCIKQQQSRYTFAAKELDDETRYSYFGARYYDSDLSVWLTVDPMARKYAGVSPYAYSLNNPIVFKDPDGRDVVVAVQDAGTSSTSGHMRMFVSTYEEVNVLIDGEERTMYKSTGVAMIQNWPHGTNTATEVEDNYQADVREGNVQIFVLDKDNRAVMGDDGQMYYTAETTQLERDIYADASSRNEPYRDGTSYLDQNDCSSIIISLLYRNGYKKLKYGEKTGTTTVDVQGQDYTFYTPNSIALDLGENHKAITIKPQNARDITFKNAMEFLKGVIESNL